VARDGQIINATLVPAPRQHSGKKELLAQGVMPTDWKPTKRCRKDVDATWTKKHGKSHFGYKLSINVDRKYRIIRRIKMGTASTHNSQHVDKVFDTSNTSHDVHADRGYPSQEREAWRKEKGLRDQIQRKGKRNKPLSGAIRGKNGDPPPGKMEIGRKSRAAFGRDHCCSTGLVGCIGLFEAPC
jgi:IS5 family transposase